MNVYDKASAALNDDYENVRLAAIKLIWVFSHTCPDRSVQNIFKEKYKYVKYGRGIRDITFTLKLLKLNYELIDLFESLCIGKAGRCCCTFLGGFDYFCVVVFVGYKMIMEIIKLKCIFQYYYHQFMV